MNLDLLRGKALLCFLLLLSYSAFAGGPKWTAEFPGAIQWHRVTSLGNLIVNTTDGFYGIDPETGKIAWSNKTLGPLDEGSFEEIPNSPFVSVSSPDKLATYILEPFEGGIVFSSKAAGLAEVKDKFFLYRNNCIIILGVKQGEKSSSMSMIDMTTGKELWTKGNEFGIVSSFYELEENEFIISTLFFIYKMNAKTGDVIWKKLVDKKYEKFEKFLGMLDKGSGGMKAGDVNVQLYKSPDNTTVYMALQQKNQTTKDGQTTYSYSSVFNAFSIASGDQVWAAPLEYQGQLQPVMVHPSGLIISQNNVNLLDSKTGKPMWGNKGKGISVKGDLVRYEPFNNNILLITGKASSSDNYLNILDPSSGSLKYEKFLRLNGSIQRKEQVSKGLVIVTNEEMNILNTSNGEYIFENSIPTKGSLTTSASKLMYVFNTKEDCVYEVDKESGTSRKINAVPVKFEGKEDPSSIELRNNNIIISSDQNIASVTMDGKVSFQKYYPAPRLPDLKRALLYASAARAAYIGVVAGVASGAYGAASQSIQPTNTTAAITKEATAGISHMYGDLSKAGMSYASKTLTAANQRFKASANSAECVFMMVGVDKKQNVLVKVSKDNGDKTDIINLGEEKNPGYEVDDIMKRVYYKSNPKKIDCYQF